MNSWNVLPTFVIIELTVDLALFLNLHPLTFDLAQHIERCLTLTELFRQLPKSHHHRNDRLGTKDVMLHAIAHALATLSAPATHHATAAADEASAGSSCLKRRLPLYCARKHRASCTIGRRSLKA